ncbi:MAG: MFS transporter [Chloroflexota bacterium]
MNPTYRGKLVFYGWVIVGVLMVLNIVNVSLLTINLGLFVNPVSADLGLNKALFGWAQTARLVGVTVSGYLIGRILDSYGARRMLMALAVLAAVGMFAFSRITAGWQLLAVLFYMGALGLHGSGGNLYTVVPLSQWFVRQRGKAMSIAFLGMPLGIFFIVPLTQYLIGNIGWRNTTVVFGISALIIIPLISPLIGRRPEDRGLLPDGDSRVRPAFPDDTVGESAGVQAAEYPWTRGEAVRTSAFWKLSIATGITFFAGSMLAVYRIPYFVGLGMDPQIVSYSLSLEAVFSVTISFIVARALARIEVRYLLAFGTLMMATTFLVLIISSQVWHVFLAGAILGIGIQSRIILEGTVWSVYYGKQHIGKIRGIAVPMTVVFSFAGGPFAGVVYNASGSFLLAWQVTAVLLVISAALVVTTSKPVPPRALPESV